MSSTTPDDSVGAVRRQSRRRGGWVWWALLGLAGLVVLAGLGALIHHFASGSSHHSGASQPAALVGGGGHVPVDAKGSHVSSATAGVVLFAANSATVDTPARQVIIAAAGRLRHEHAHHVTVTGYTDIVAGRKENKTLSRHRADHVAAVLRHMLGKRYAVKVRARGQADPIASNKTRAGRAQNRRVTVVARH